jgi:TetR/AcrR family tetracycline transcriptional repressor
VARPKEPLIDKAVAIQTALDIIDKDGVEALSIRRLGVELGVNGASLYHHFSDKEEILDGVRRLVLQRLRVPKQKDIAWQDFTIAAAKAFRKALLRHPNTAPLMVPQPGRPLGLTMRDFAAEIVERAGVPEHLVYPIIDSTETLAFGAALINPTQIKPSRLLTTDTKHVHLRAAVAADTLTNDARFERELRALVAGWEVVIEQERQAQPSDT